MAIDVRGAYDVGLGTGEECISRLREFVKQHEHERWTNPAVAMAEEVAQLLDEHVVQGLTRLYRAWFNATSPIVIQQAPCLPKPEPYRKISENRFGMSGNIVIGGEP